MDAWDDHMVSRFKKEGYLSKFEGQSKNLSDFQNTEIWIKDVTEKTLSFFSDRPHLKFIDVCIENLHTPKLLADFFHVPSIDLEHENTGHYASHDKTAAPTPTYLEAEDWLKAFNYLSTFQPTPNNNSKRRLRHT